MAQPKIIALCGNPGSGKSTAAELIATAFGYELIDDGKMLREIACEYFGVTNEQAYSQAGKKDFVNLAGKSVQVREILGETGNALEEKFGTDIIPWVSLNSMDPKKFYVLGSVRRDQGVFWANNGATVMEISNPDAGPSHFSFDRFARGPISHVILNDGPSRGLSDDQSLLLLLDRIEATWK